MTTTPPRSTASDRLLFNHLLTIATTTDAPIAVPLERTAHQLSLAPRTVSRSLERLQAMGALTRTPGKQGRGHLTVVTIDNPEIFHTTPLYDETTTAPTPDTTGRLSPADCRRVFNAVLHHVVEVPMATAEISVLSGIIDQADTSLTSPVDYDGEATRRYFRLSHLHHDAALRRLGEIGFIDHPGDGQALRLRIPAGWEQFGAEVDGDA